MHNAERASSIEEGIFGLTNVKLGADAKEQRVLLHSMSCFRRAALAVLLTLVLALGCALRYRWTAARTTIELVATNLRRSAAECGGIVEGILLKQDEIEELARRLRQRELFDNFLDAEKNVEEEFRLRVLKLIQKGNESNKRKTQLKDAFTHELQWFMDSVDAKVEEIIGPLDAAFRDVPEQVKDLQSQIVSALLAFEPGSACENIRNAAEGARWESVLHARVERMIKGMRREEARMHGNEHGRDPGSRRETSAHRSLDLAQSWEVVNSKGAREVVSAELFAALLRWYSGLSAHWLSHHFQLGSLAAPASKYST